MSEDPASEEIIRITVPQTMAGERVDRVFAMLAPGHSRSELKRLIVGGCLIGGNGDRTIDMASYRVKPGERLVLRIPPGVPADPDGEDIPLAVVFEDEHLIVVDKPPGLVVHPAPGNLQGTLVNALIAHCGPSLKGIGGVLRPGIVHRLDKDTSGLLVAAKTAAAHESLAAGFAERTVSRAYAAFVWGVPRPEKGEIAGNIGRDRNDRKKMAVLSAGGRPALTRYRTEVGYRDGAAAQLECRLATGRTHQIRVHLASRGHPIIGDPVYGGGATRARRSALPDGIREVVARFSRQALHAKLLGFRHPATGEDMLFESRLPEDIEELEQTFKGA